MVFGDPNTARLVGGARLSLTAPGVWFDTRTEHSRWGVDASVCWVLRRGEIVAMTTAQIEEWVQAILDAQKQRQEAAGEQENFSPVRREDIEKALTQENVAMLGASAGQ